MIDGGSLIKRRFAVHVSKNASVCARAVATVYTAFLSS